MYGSTIAFVAELAISFILMITVLFATNSKAGPIYRVFCRLADPDLSHIRNAAVRHEHQPSTNLRFSSARQLLGCAVDLLHRSGAGHVGRSQFFAPIRGAPLHIALNYITTTINAVSSTHITGSSIPRKVIHSEKARKGESHEQQLTCRIYLRIFSRKNLMW